VCIHVLTLCCVKTGDKQVVQFSLGSRAGGMPPLSEAGSQIAAGVRQAAAGVRRQRGKGSYGAKYQTHLTYQD